jgi:hypothetical protein
MFCFVRDGVGRPRLLCGLYMFGGQCQFSVVSALQTRCGGLGYSLGESYPLCLPRSSFNPLHSQLHPHRRRRHRPYRHHLSLQTRSRFRKMHFLNRSRCLLEPNPRTLNLGCSTKGGSDCGIDFGNINRNLNHI